MLDIPEMLIIAPGAVLAWIWTTNLLERHRGPRR
jgi:hypothetical protein